MQDEVTFFVRTYFFVYIGLLITIDGINLYVIGFSVLMIVLTVLARFISTNVLFFKESAYNKTVMIGMIPRGLAAAVLASMPFSYNLNVPSSFETIVFLVIFLSNIITSGVSLDDYAIITPTKSNAIISSSNGLVKTSNRINMAAFDSERIYFASGDGVDVITFEKENGLVKKNIAYVKDGYNINSMYLASFGKTYKHSSSSLPYLVNKNPVENGSMNSSDTLSFTITGNLSVNIQDTYVYINDTLAFAGYPIGNNTGWVNGFNGHITTGFRQLNFFIKSSFSTGSLKIYVEATDINNNKMEEVYYINII